MLLLVPRTGVSTAQCYALYDKMLSDAGNSDTAESALVSGDLKGLSENLSNALTAPAIVLNGEVGKARKGEDFNPSQGPIDPEQVMISGGRRSRGSIAIDPEIAPETTVSLI